MSEATTPDLARLEVLANGLLADLFGSHLADDMGASRKIVMDHLQKMTALHQRVFDLLRQQRSALLDLQLITRAEHDWLLMEGPYWEAGDPDIRQPSPAARRVATYDEHETRMKLMRTAVAMAIVTCPHCGPHPDQPVCSQCKQLRTIVREAITHSGDQP